MSEGTVYGYNVVVTRSYFVTVKAKSAVLGSRAFDSGDIQTEEIHEYGSLNLVEIDSVEYVGVFPGNGIMFDVTDLPLDELDTELLDDEFLTNLRGEIFWLGGIVTSVETEKYNLFSRETMEFVDFDPNAGFEVEDLQVDRDEMTLRSPDGSLFHACPVNAFKPVCEYYDESGMPL